MIDVAGIDLTAKMLATTEAQARNLAAGTGRVFRSDRDAMGRIEQDARLFSGDRLARLQYVVPKGIAREDIPLAMRRLARDMRYDSSGDRTLKRRQDYMKHLRDLGMDPNDLPDPLAT